MHSITMIPTKTPDPKASPPEELPSDLYTLMGERTLISLALQAVDAVAARLPRWVEPPDSKLSPRMLLTLLTYCYAAGTYASEDIEWACQRPGGARYIAGHAQPDQDAVRHFRRANRPWIEECLAWLLERASQQMPHLAGAFGVRQVTSGDLPESPFLKHARHRVELATLMDMALAD